ncbi:hypothetical protein FRC01_013950, partial [Tulasnella sp. 417]
GSTEKSLSDIIATEIAVYKAVEALIRRRRNECTLFLRLPTDVVHSIFGFALDVDRIHDADLPSDALKETWDQLERMRRVSFAWNKFLLSSPRYWQAIDITGSAKKIALAVKRSGSAPLCLYSFTTLVNESSVRLVPADRVQTLRSNEIQAYPLYRRFLQNPMPVLQTLELRAPPWMGHDRSKPLGNLRLLRHLNAQWWQPSADAACLPDLKELILWHYPEPDMELLRVLSACANLEKLEIVSMNEAVPGEVPGTILPIITLPRLRSISLQFKSNKSVMKLIRRLAAPQCLRRTVRIDQAGDLGSYIADYRRFVSSEERYIGQYPESAALLLDSSYPGTRLEYKTKNLEVSLRFPSIEEIPAFHDLVREFQTVFKGPSLTVTIEYPSEQTWSFLKSIGDQNVQTIVARLKYRPLGASDKFLKVIAARLSNLPGLEGPEANAVTDVPFKSLMSIEIHDTQVNLVDFIGLVEEYLDENSKPWLEEIVLVDCSVKGMEWEQAVERLNEIGLTLRLVVTDEGEDENEDEDNEVTSED